MTGVGVSALVLAPLRVGGMRGPESSKRTEAPARLGSLVPGEKLASELRTEKGRSVPHPCNSIAIPTQGLQSMLNEATFGCVEQNLLHTQVKRVRRGSRHTYKQALLGGLL